MALLLNTVVFQIVIQSIVGCSVGGLLGDIAHNSRPWTECGEGSGSGCAPRKASRSESQRLRSIKTMLLNKAF